MFKFRVGEDVRIMLSVGETDSINDITKIVAKITPIHGGTETNMIVTSRIDPLGWDIVLPNNFLPIGLYVIDAKITFNSGEVIITEQSANIEITRGALV
jgi:hypothetical protein